MLYLDKLLPVLSAKRKEWGKTSDLLKRGSGLAVGGQHLMSTWNVASFGPKAIKLKALALRENLLAHFWLLLSVSAPCKG